MQIDMKVGMRVSLFVRRKNADEETGIISLSSIIEDIPNDEDIIIQSPTYRGYVYPLPREPIAMRFFLDGAPYSLMVQFEERITHEKYLLAKLKRMSPISKHQIRSYFRLDCFLPIVIGRKIKNGDIEEDRLVEGYALNLSEGGMRVTTDEDIEAGEKLVVTIDIGKLEALECTVIRTEESTDTKCRYTAGLKFKFRNRSQSDRIYKYIVSKQLVLIQRAKSKIEE